MPRADRHMVGLAIDEDLEAWVKWAGKHRAVSMTRYLNDLARADMERARDGADTWAGFMADDGDGKR